MSKRMYLTMWLNSSGFHEDSWNAGGGDRSRIFKLENYIRNAQIARRGCIDSVFFADQAQLTADPKERAEYPIDPIVLATAITTNVPDIGVIATSSTSFSLPYTLARQIASANMMSEGRVGWNAVTTINPVVAGNYGQIRANHDERYARAEEFLKVVHALWRSWEFPWDHVSGPVENPYGKVSPLDFEGEYFKVAGALNVPLPPFGVPVVAQAGGSAQGKRLGAKYGEIIYAVFGSKAGGQRYMQEVKAGAVAQGRNPSDIKIFPSFQPYVVSSQDEAKSTRERLQSELDPSGEGMAKLAWQLGIDLEKTGLERPLREEDFAIRSDTVSAVGALNAYKDVALDEGLGFRDLAMRLKVIIGTPDEIAERMIDWWEAGAADGFTINPPVLPDAATTFVDEVVPILQERGVFPTEYTEPTLRSRLGFPQS